MTQKSNVNDPVFFEIPEILYHATYRHLLDSIIQNGLGNSKCITQKMWEDSDSQKVYLADNIDVALSFAETAELAEDDWLDDVVVISIYADKLDASKFQLDPNILDNDGYSLIYDGVIDRQAIQRVLDGNKSIIYKESSPILRQEHVVPVSDDVSSNKEPSKNVWLPVKKIYQKTCISVDEKHPPFDGSPVIVYTSHGAIQALWEKGTVIHYLEGDEYDGFCWSTSRNDLLEIDEVKAWMPLPEKEHISRPISHSPEETEKLLPHDPVLILSKTYGWVEAWYDDEEQVWQAMDADFTIEDEDVLTWETLPILEDSVLIEWEEQEETEARNHSEETETEPVNLNFLDNF